MSKIVPKQNLVKENKYDIKCPYTMNPTRIVVHNTANDACAANEISYMISNNNYTSFHFAIDDKEVVQGIPLNRNSWHSSDGTNGVGNRQGISIEICYSKSGGERFILAEKLAAKFIAQLLLERNWDISKVTKHQDYCTKYCPHRTLDMGWQRFLNMISDEMKLQGGVQTTPAQKFNGETYEVFVPLSGHLTADDSIKGINQKTTVNPGIYSIFRKLSNGSYNLTKNEGTPGAWVDTSKNIKVSERENTDIYEGKELQLINVPLYSSSTSTRKSKDITGTYFLWSSEVINKRVKITNDFSRVGVSGQVTGWITESSAKVFYSKTVEKVEEDKTIDERIWKFLKSKGFSDYAIAGIEGNIYAESGLIPNNLQNSYEKILGLNDKTYTEAVDKGIYTNFVYDSAGYGLAQWTYWSRKKNLLDYVKSVNKSVGDLNSQLEFLVKELSSYKGLVDSLNKAVSVREASDLMMTQYEKPKNQSESNKKLRASYCQTYYDKFKETVPVDKFSIGDTVRIKPTATSYANGKKIPTWVKNSTLYVRSQETSSGTILVSIYKTGAVTGYVRVSSIYKI